MSEEKLRALLEEARAEIARLEENENALMAVNEKQSRLLKETVNILRGPPPELGIWSHHDIPERVKKLRAETTAAYQRGAEVMREAAAACVGSDTALLHTYRSVLEGRIRDLPIPEDK